MFSIHFQMFIKFFWYNVSRQSQWNVINKLYCRKFHSCANNTWEVMLKTKKWDWKLRGITPSKMNLRFTTLNHFTFSHHPLSIYIKNHSCAYITWEDMLQTKSSMSSCLLVNKCGHVVSINSNLLFLKIEVNLHIRKSWLFAWVEFKIYNP